MKKNYQNLYSDKNNKYNILLEKSENKLSIYGEVETNSGEKKYFSKSIFFNWNTKSEIIFSL